jgi:hypothetical protein
MTSNRADNEDAELNFRGANIGGMLAVNGTTLAGPRALAINPI